MKIEAVLTGCVIHKGRDIVVCAMQEADRKGHTSFHVRLGTDWFGYTEEPEWPAVGMAATQYPGTDSVLIVAAAADGRTWELNPSTKIEQLGRIGEGHCGITRLTVIEGSVWACGMERRVMRREVSGRWTDVSAPSGTSAEGIRGFTGIAELGNGEILAVGWQGEIWLRTTQGWTKQDSPTNSNLNNLSVSPTGDVLIVGDRGSLVHGRPGQWKTLNAQTNFNLTGVCYFGGDIFVCSEFEIFVLKDERIVRETRFADDQRPRTCMNFLTGKDGVYCQGERDLYLFDGTRWANVL